MRGWLGLLLIGLTLVGCAGPGTAPTPVATPTGVAGEARAAVVSLLDGYNRAYPVALEQGNPAVVADYFDPQGPAWISRVATFRRNAGAATAQRTRFDGLAVDSFRIEDVDLAVVATTEVWDVWTVTAGKASPPQTGLTVVNLYTVRRTAAGWRIYAIDQQPVGR